VTKLVKLAWGRVKNGERGAADMSVDGKRLADNCQVWQTANGPSLGPLHTTRGNLKTEVSP